MPVIPRLVCLWFLPCFALACSCLSGCAPSSEREVVVGMELNYPPFEMVNSNGKPAGISVEMANALGAYLRRPARIENIPFDGLIPALKTGRIDLIISSMTKTAEREQSIDFSEPYLRTGLCLLLGKDVSANSINDVDRTDSNIAVKQGTTGQAYARAHLTKAHVLTLDKEDACVLEVVQGKAQAFIYDQMSIYKHWQQHQDTTRALLNPFQEEQWAIGIRKGNNELRQKVNAFLADFKTNGGFEKLGEQYLKEQKDAFKKVGVPFYF